MEKNKRTVGDVIIGLIRLICIVTIICCLIYLGQWYLESRRQQDGANAVADSYVVTTSAETAGDGGTESAAEEEGKPTRCPIHQIDFDGLREMNPDVCGWIWVSGIDVINYPIVHGEDDAFYLNHGADRSSDRYGAIFMETLNSPDLSDPYTVIYGHNMRNGSMFGSIKKYADKSFYQENGGIVHIDTPEGTFDYEIFSVEYVKPDSPEVFTLGYEFGDEYTDYITAMKKRSLYDTGVEVSPTDRVITLSTCHNQAKSRFVIHAKISE